MTLSTPPASAWDDEQLAALRQVGDPDADEYVDSLVLGLSPEDRLAWLASAIETLRAVRVSEEAWLLDWENAPVDLPSWVCESLVRSGQDVFDRWSLDITTALFCASLPLAYASGRGAAVLATTSELMLERTAGKRVALTGQMLLDISGSDFLRCGEDGYRTLRRVRLLHACVRASLMHGDPLWPAEARGVPINQEDLMATQLAFTTAVFRAISRLGHRMSDQEELSYLHLWSAVGHLIGIDEAERLTDLGAAEELTDILLERLTEASPQGVELMRTLLDSIAATMPWFLRSFPAALVRRLAGELVADVLEVPHSRWAVAIAATAAVDRAISRSSVGRLALRLPSRLFGRAAIRRSIARDTLATDDQAYWPHRFS
jgi:hypothetical protein